MNFLTMMFSSSSSVSWGRVGSFLALIFTLVWVSFIVYYERKIPELGGLSLFIVTLYGVSKAGDTIMTLNKKEPEQ